MSSLNKDQSDDKSIEQFANRGFRNDRSLLPLFLLIPYKDCEYHLTSCTGNYSSILNENV